MKNSKRGSIFVEASLVYPLIIVVTILMMSVSLFFYSMAAQLSDMNRCVRRAAGEKSGTVFYGETVDTAAAFTLSERAGLFSSSIAAEGSGTFRSTLIYVVGERISCGARAEILCEMDKVRLQHGIGSLIGELTG